MTKPISLDADIDAIKIVLRLLIKGLRPEARTTLAQRASAVVDKFESRLLYETTPDGHAALVRERVADLLRTEPSSR